MTRPLHAPQSLSPEVDRAMNEFHSDVVKTVGLAVEKNPVVVIGMAQNPFVKKARQALDKAGITYTYLEYGSYLSQWKQRLAIKLWSGWPTFPQVFVRGVLIGGANDTIRSIKEGKLAAK